LFSSIASYKITGENVAAKQEIIRSKMKLVDQTAFNVKKKFFHKLIISFALFFFVVISS
jgi:hypothetical protein